MGYGLDFRRNKGISEEWSKVGLSGDVHKRHLAIERLIDLLWLFELKSDDR